jgi:hypothetical protein
VVYGRACSILDYCREVKRRKVDIGVAQTKFHIVSNRMRNRVVTDSLASAYPPATASVGLSVHVICGGIPVFVHTNHGATML